MTQSRAGAAWRSDRRYWSVAECASAQRRGDVSAVELVDEAIARVEAAAFLHRAGTADTSTGWGRTGEAEFFTPTWCAAAPSDLSGEWVHLNREGHRAERCTVERQPA